MSELDELGCSNYGCDITGPTSGMHTNGRCHCLDGLRPDQRVKVRKAFDLLRAEIGILRYGNANENAYNEKIRAENEKLKKGLQCCSRDPDCFGCPYLDNAGDMPHCQLEGWER